MTKTFSTLAVVGAWSGRLLVAGGFSDIHEVMDFFYPGCMAHNLPSLHPRVAEEILRQHPSLADLPPITSENFEAVAAQALKDFGLMMSLTAP